LHNLHINAGRLHSARNHLQGVPRVTFGGKSAPAGVG
jgi:hypothetical protein